MPSLVVQTSFLGDVVLTTPLIAELAKRGDVDVLTTPAGATVLRNDPGIRNIIVYDRRDADRGIAGFARTVGRIRHAGLYGSLDSSGSPALSRFYDAAYLAQGSFRSALLVASTGVKTRIGFNTSEGRRLYTDLVEYRPDRHHAERLWWLSMCACADAPDPDQITPRLYPSLDDDRAAAGFLLDHLDDSRRPLIVLAPGSAWGTKRWPFYTELGRRLADASNIVVVGGAAEIQVGNEIVKEIPDGRGANAAGKLGILASASLIGRATLIVSNDSAPQHIASAMGTRTVTVFGPTVPEFGFGPLAPGSITGGNNRLACRPCDRHGPQRCPLGHWRCMRELSADYLSGIIMQALTERASA